MQEVVGSSPISSTLKKHAAQKGGVLFCVFTFLGCSSRSTFERWGVGQSGFHEKFIDHLDFVFHRGYL